MPHWFVILLTAILAADLLWWRRADRLARPLRRAFWWRLLIGLFMGGQVALALWILGGRALAESPLSRPPQVLSAAAYLWHLLILPAACALVVTAGVLLRVWRAGRRFARPTSTGRQDAPAVAGPDPVAP